MTIDLDNWITGHYGEDQYRDEELEIEDDLDPVTEEETHFRYRHGIRGE
jgi:hypothetical protein